jgi:acetate kinase
MVPDSNHPTPCLTIINCGSSSLKFAIFPLVGETAWFKGLAERLHCPEATLTIKREGMTEVIAIPLRHTPHRT